MGNGRVSEIHGANGMNIRRGPGYERRGMVERGGHTYNFNRAGYGHVRSSYSYRGREYAVRHYYVGGRAFPRYYRPYAYRGVFLDAYSPVVFYSPGYYGWAYHPWAAPVVFSFGFAAAPWYGYYGGYFAPAPVYASGPMWLTDYMIGATLEAAYRERIESAAVANGQQPPPYGQQYSQQQQYADPQQYQGQPPPQQQVVAITPEIKQLIAEEVQRQISLEMAEAKAQSQAQAQGQNAVAQNTSAALDPGFSGVAKILADRVPHIFLSSADIDVATTTGQECQVRQGDVLQWNPGGDPNDPMVPLTIMTTTGGGCPKGSVINIGVQDLQEMQNHMRATIDSGLGEMKNKQGQGLPSIPSQIQVTTSNADFVTAAPPPDPSEATQLRQFSQEATQTEQAVVGELSGGQQQPGAAPQQPAAVTQVEELQPGMTIEQVIRMKGAPPSPPTKFGSKTIIQYPTVKLTFVDGKLADIQ
jgi:hypothetical protein